jgi:DNA-binding PadR family transcriptional regulator
MPNPRSPASLLPLAHDVLLILLALAAEPRHGYGIIRDVDERSNGTIALQTGALYRALKRLLADGLIEASAPPHGTPADSDSRRRYYCITAFGARVLAAEVDRMAVLVRAAHAIEAGRRPRFA